MSDENRMQMADAPPRDEQLPGLGVVLDPEAVTASLAARLEPGWEILSPCRATYVRYKPCTSCLVAHELELRDTQSGATRRAVLYGKCYAPDAYLLAAAKVATWKGVPTPGFAPAIELPEARAILYGFPNDRMLPGLRLLGRRKKLRRLLASALHAYPAPAWRISDSKLQLEVVRYKPEKRAVVRITTRATHLGSNTREKVCVYLRTYSAGRGERVFRLAQRLRKRLAGETELRLPRALAWLPLPRLLLFEALPGRPWIETLGDFESAAVAARVGRDLARLHACGERGVKGRRIEDRLEEARATGEASKSLLPERREVVQGVFARLAALRPAEPVGTGFVHGDFHPGQVLVQDGGIAMLDFDRAHRGDTVADLGNFIANLRAQAWFDPEIDAGPIADAFLHAYEEAAQRRIEPQHLRFWTRFGLFQLAVRPFREQAPAWRSRMETILQRCMEEP